MLHFYEQLELLLDEILKKFNAQQDKKKTYTLESQELQNYVKQHFPFAWTMWVVSFHNRHHEQRRVNALCRILYNRAMLKCTEVVLNSLLCMHRHKFLFVDMKLENIMFKDTSYSFFFKNRPSIDVALGDIGSIVPYSEKQPEFPGRIPITYLNCFRQQSDKHRFDERFISRDELQQQFSLFVFLMQINGYPPLRCRTREEKIHFDWDLYNQERQAHPSFPIKHHLLKRQFPELDRSQLFFAAMQEQSYLDFWGTLLVKLYTACVKNELMQVRADYNDPKKGFRQAKSFEEVDHYNQALISTYLERNPTARFLSDDLQTVEIQ